MTGCLLKRLVNRIENTTLLSFYAASLLVFFMLLIVVTDVLGRDLFSMPFLGSVELISLILPAIVFLALPNILLTETLIASQAIADELGKKFRGIGAFLKISFLLISLSLGFLFLISNSKNLFQSFFDKEFLGVPGDFILAVWPSKLGLVFASFLFICVHLNL